MQIFLSIRLKPLLFLHRNKEIENIHIFYNAADIRDVEATGERLNEMCDLSGLGVLSGRITINGDTICKIRYYRLLKRSLFFAYFNDTMCCITVPEWIVPCTGNLHHPVCYRENLFCIRTGEHIGTSINGFRSLRILTKGHTWH